ncbi:hypothetical protein BURPS406E_G0251 [Burkholderia pseudomallei 406e]|nr:hypothetical protein BURPS406E_G0251 [Burkholderia pseudomallei 406e]
MIAQIESNCQIYSSCFIGRKWLNCVLFVKTLIRKILIFCFAGWNREGGMARVALSVARMS